MAKGPALTVESDVCIVGSGPAGLTLASELVRAGRQVAILESGRDRSSSRVQRLNDGEVEGEPYHGLRATRHRQLGGTANIWNTTVQDQPGAKYVPLDRRDVATWPIRWDELEPWYHGAQQVCGLGPFDYAVRPAGSPGHGLPRESRSLASAVYQLGTADRFVHDLPRALRSTPGCQVMPETTVTNVQWNPSTGRVASIRAVTLDGRPIECRSSQFVLACGAIENARLLLLTGLDRTNGLTWIGKGFMEHPRDFSMLLWPDDPVLLDGAPFFGPQPPRGGAPTQGRLAVTAEALERHGLPNASVSLFPRPRPGTAQGLAWRLVQRIHRMVGVAWGGGALWESKRSPREQFDAFSVVMHMEQRPSPGNFVSLGSRTDRFGNPLPRLRLGWSADEQEELERLRHHLRDWMGEAGIGRLVITEGSRPDFNAHHHAGTTRMGTGPEEAVVDPEGRVFGTENLYIAGASVFPTSGFANPVLTIVAMALRLADHLSATR